MKSYQNPQPQAVDRIDKEMKKNKKKKKREQSKELDKDLKDTFPASDPITKY